MCLENVVPYNKITSTVRLTICRLCEQGVVKVENLGRETVKPLSAHTRTPREEEGGDRGEERREERESRRKGERRKGVWGEGHSCVTVPKI